MQPYVAIMRRYCIDYTSAHDPSVADEILADDYTITISGRTMNLGAYRDAVSAAFRRYPTLMLTVHDLILSGDRLAMRFSEHGAIAGRPDRVAVWQGISLYRCDGRKLLSCRVEQDFLGRDEQAESGPTAPLAPPHPDPWATTRDAPTHPSSEGAVRAWLDQMTVDPAAMVADPSVELLEIGEAAAPLLDGQTVVVDDLFSAGDRVAAAITIHGTYVGGLPGVQDEAVGLAASLPATLLTRVEDGAVVDTKLVRDRWGLVRRLRNALRG